MPMFSKRKIRLLVQVLSKKLTIQDDKIAASRVCTKRSRMGVTLCFQATSVITKAKKR